MQIKTNDHDQDTWLHKESETDSIEDRLSLMNEMFHIAEMLLKATSTRLMDIHLHIEEVKND